VLSFAVIGPKAFLEVLNTTTQKTGDSYSTITRRRVRETAVGAREVHVYSQGNNPFDVNPTFADKKVQVEALVSKHSRLAEPSEPR
jgi:hypothetical protein